MLEVRRLRKDEDQLLKDVMLRMYADTPTAFGETLADAQAYSEGEWRRSATEYSTDPNMVAFVVMESGSANAFVRASVLPKKVLEEFEGPSEASAAGEFSDTTVLRHMWVAPQLRGQGVAQALIQAVIAWARDKGQRRVVLAVTEGNEIAERCYTRAGFVRNGLSFPHPWHPAKILLMEYLILSHRR